MNQTEVHWHTKYCLTLLVAIFLEQALAEGFTPLGAELEANADRSIPRWEYRALSDNEYAAWVGKIEEDSPLFIITAKNVNQYAAHLSQGMLKMFSTYPETYRVPVYPSHRSAVLPQWLYDNAQKNKFDAKISEDGEEVTFAWPGIPFPFPRQAKEVMWNHQLRWKGLFFTLNTIEALVLRDGQYTIINNVLEVHSEYHNLTRPRKIEDWRYTYYLSYIKNPAQLAGGAYLSHETMKPITKPRQSWMYLAGQRRMRRSPVMGYDAPTFTSDGLRMMDEIDMFNGAMDLYDWELRGKRELYVPYNNSRLRKALLNESDVLTPNHVNPEFVRYEKHRVWVVDAVLKPGKHHIYKRRTFYLDEDTWGILLVDIYNENNQLWRVSQRFAAHYYRIPVMLTALDAFNDLNRKTYYIQAVPEGDIEHSYTPPPSGYFNPNSVRQRMRR